MSGINPQKTQVKTVAKPPAKTASTTAVKTTTKTAAKPSSQNNKKPAKRKVRFSTILMLIFSAGICLMLSAMLISYNLGLDFSRKEYAGLREIEERYSDIEEPEAKVLAGSDTLFVAPYVSPFDTEMQTINPEYICWIKIEATKVDYPVVRAEDNEKYLNMSFSGEKNRLGALFMDYRCIGEYVPHIIIYGHNAREGDMFGELKKYLNEQYMEEHPLIVLKANDRIVEYEVFAVRKTNVDDPAFFIDFSEPGSFQAFLERNSAPIDATQIITLSTCVSAGNDKERIIVQGVFR